MTEQIAVRIPTDALEGLDGLVAAGHYASRAAALRAGIDLILRVEREKAIADEYREGYGASPQDEWVGSVGLALGADLVDREAASGREEIS